MAYRYNTVGLGNLSQTLVRSSKYQNRAAIAPTASSGLPAEYASIPHVQLSLFVHGEKHVYKHHWDVGGDDGYGALVYAFEVIPRHVLLVVDDVEMGRMTMDRPWWDWHRCRRNPLMSGHTIA
ncbi:hypothetical protein FS749_008300 [Ceratobasidium sp. UAMH 11750]|nr:hypothetical protein FS749_008300 [Ceratobasidium sp. UAMH 11750]